MFSRDTIVRTAQSARAHTPAFRRQEGKPVTEGKRSAGIVSTFLSAIGIGLAFSWYLFPVAKSNAHIFHTGPLAGTLPVSVGIVIPLVLLGLLGNRLDEKKARRIVLAAGLALCLVSLVLAECIRAGLCSKTQEARPCRFARPACTASPSAFGRKTCETAPSAELWCPSPSGFWLRAPRTWL